MLDTMKHSRFSASAAHRWLNCPASLVAIERLREQGLLTEQYNTAAEEGSLAHSFAYEMLCGKNIETSDIEMAEAINGYVDYISKINGVKEFEKKVSYEQWVLGGYGTADAIVYDLDNLVIHIIDFKYGVSKVDAANNEQLMLYALGATVNMVSKYGVAPLKYVLHIYQPRVYNIETWELTFDTLMQFGEKVTDIAIEALSPDAPFVIGDKQCKWCEYKPFCAKQKELVASNFSVIPNVEDLTHQQREELLSIKSLVEGFLDAVEKKVYNDLLTGSTSDSYKLVEGRSMRKWTPDGIKQLEEALGDDAYSKSPIGLGEAEKKLGKMFVEKCTFKAEGKPSLVKMTDKRPRLDRLDVVSCFTKID